MTQEVPTGVAGPVRRVLLLASVVAAAIILVFVVAFSVVSWRSEYQRHVENQQSLAALGERSMNTFFHQLESALGLLADEVAEHREYHAPHAALQRLREFRNQFPLLSGISLIAPDGRFLAWTGAEAGSALPTIANEPDFTESMRDLADGKSFTISRPILGRIAGQWLVSLRYAARDAQGKLLFIVAGGLPLSQAQAFWAQGPYPTGTSLGILRDDGFLLVRHPLPHDTTPEDIYRTRRGGALYQHLQANGFPNAGVVEGQSTSLREDVVIAFRRFERYQLTFMVITPKATLWTRWWSDVWPLYALIAALVLAGIAINVWISGVQRRWDGERLRHIANLEATNQRLNQANRELDAFSYMVAHDLRAPVRALDGFGAILKEDFGARLGDDGNLLLTRIREAAGRMGSLIDGLLSLARLSRGEIKRELVNTRTVVASVCAELAPDCPARFRIGDLPDCYADPVLLRIVWANLLSNAFKFSRLVESPVIDIGYSSGAYFVRDNGVGFDMAHAHNLFGAFSRLHGPEQFEGTGIGLAIVKRVIERHGGSVNALGEVGQGAEFRFSLGQAERVPMSGPAATPPP